MSEFLMLMGICTGLGVGLAITTWIAGLLGLLGDMYKEWHGGRQLARMVAETNRKRRAELLAKMIELERAMEPVLSAEPVSQWIGGLSTKRPS
jgi:hypothetical protein